MQLKKWAFLLAPIVLLLASFTQIKKPDYIILQGQVLNQQTGKPINEAHVFIIAGEEEALTDIKGEFQIKTWQKLPLQLTVVNYKTQEQVKINISDAGKKQVIKLKSSN